MKAKYINCERGQKSRAWHRKMISIYTYKLSSMSAKYISADGFLGLNIGGFLQAHLAYIKITGINTILLRVSNSSLYGTFPIPNSLGFSTPLSDIGRGGTFILNVDPNDKSSKLLEEFTIWRKTFNTVPSTYNTPLKYTRDHRECAICITEYELGDERCKLTCGHFFSLQMLKTDAQPCGQEKSCTTCKFYHGWLC